MENILWTRSDRSKIDDAMALKATVEREELST